MSYGYSQFNGWNIVPMPAKPGPRTVTMRAVDPVGQTASPFTAQSQVQQWVGADWLELDITLPPMALRHAQNWIAFLQALRGKANVFQCGHPLGRVPANGAPWGGIALNATHLAGASVINTTNWSVATANLYPDPDMLSTSTWSATTLASGGAVHSLMFGGGASGSGNAYGLWGGTGITWTAGTTVQTAAIAVTAGATYTVSGYVEARSLLSGLYGVTVYGSGAQIASAFATPGASNRVAATFTVPAGVSSIAIYWGAATNVTVAQNKMISVSNPLLQTGTVANPYVSPASLAPGDFLQIGYRLHQVAGPIGVYPVAGAAAIEIYPTLRETQPAGTLLNFYNPTGIWRLADNKREWSANETMLYGLSFKAIEAR